MPGHLAEPVPDRAHGLDEMGVLLAELGPQPPDVHVHRPGAAVVLVAPDPAEQRLAREHLRRVPGQEAEQLVLHVGQVQDPARDRRLVGLEVQHERSVLDDVRPHALPAAPEEMLQAGHQFLGPRRQDAEVVEEVVAQEELADLPGADGEEQRRQGHLAQAHVTAEGDRGRHVVSRHDQRTRVPGRAAVLPGRRDLVGRGHAVVAEPRALQRQGHLGGQVVREGEERVHEAGAQSSGR